MYIKPATYNTRDNFIETLLVKLIRYLSIVLGCFYILTIQAQDTIKKKEIEDDVYRTYYTKPDKTNKDHDTVSEKKYPHKNNINIELGGTGLIYSLGYERNLCIKEKSYQSIKIGISYQHSFASQVFIPLDYNFYLGKGNLKLLLGAGIVGLLSTDPSPGSYNARQDYIKLYNQNPYNAISKYGTDHYQKAFDLAYTAKVGFKHIGKKVDVYGYYNCFYIRYSTSYNFQPAWFAIGLSIKI